MAHLSKKYKHIYNKLTNFELQKDRISDKLISDEDILGDLAKKDRPRLFLDYYSEQGIFKALDEYGIFKDLKKRGFKDFIIVTDTKDPYRHVFRAYYDKKKTDHLLCEAYLRKKTFLAKPIFNSDISGETFTLIVIEWLTLQNPSAQFTPQRPKLPGQKYPGLRIGRKVLGIFINMCLRLKTDGLLNIPEHYHNAAFYGRYFKYFNPQTEGHFQAIRRDLGHLGLYTISWAIELECLFETTTKKYWKWFTDEQILPVSENIKKYYKSREYIEQVNRASQTVQFTIDHDKLKERHPTKE